MIGQAIKQWFWDCYDHLGRLLVANLLLFLVLFPVLTAIPALAGPLVGPESGPLELGIAAVLSGLLTSLFCAAWLSGLLHFGQLVSAEKDPPLRSILDGIWRHYRRMLLFVLLIAAAFGLLVLNVWFYFFSGQLSGALAVAGYVIGGFFLWMIPLFAMIVMHALPHFVRTRATMWRSLRFGFLVTMKYPGLTFSILLFLVSLWIIGGALKFAGIFLFAFSGTAMLLNSLHDVLLDTEERAENLREAQKANGPAKPASWKELRAIENETEEERMRRSRYERTFRDLVRPWES